MKRAITILLFLACGNVSAEYFHGYYCTDDCSGHRAGYAWAQRNDITNTYDCTGRSQSFIEGCYAWVEENDDGYDDDAERIEEGECYDDDEDGECDDE